MFPTRSLAFGWLLLLPSSGFGQTANTVFGSAYSFPAPINTAPGQLLNLLVQGVGATLSQRIAATGLPLPTTLANISVQLTQSAAPQSVAVPLIAVRPVSTCINGTSIGSTTCSAYTVVTVQIPYELVTNCQSATQLCPSSATPFVNSAQLVVSENGVAGGAISLNPLADQIHIANLCDIDTSAPLVCSPTPLITHADGSLVSLSSPASPGEEIVIYALGLGITKPAVPTGQATPSPAPVALNVSEVNFEFGANEGSSKGVPLSLTVCSTTPTCPFTPLFAGLTPTSVGLYQVNFVVPTPTQGVIACGSGILSNLTLTIVGLTSFDGAGICVATPASETADGSPNVANAHSLSKRTISAGPSIR
jgi:uncharacterized protein (TIGR03437 family)